MWELHLLEQRAEWRGEKAGAACGAVRCECWACVPRTSKVRVRDRELKHLHSYSTKSYLCSGTDFAMLRLQPAPARQQLEGKN